MSGDMKPSRGIQNPDLTEMRETRRGTQYEAYYYTADQMHAYGDARAAAATERAAQVCDEHASIEGIAQKCAAAIRAGS